MQQTEERIDKRRVRGAGSKRQILQSAIACIASQGLSNTTLSVVAENAGVSKALVVFHFKSKSLLIKQVLDYLGMTYAEGWDAVVAIDEGSAMDKLMRLVDYDIKFAFEKPEYISAWHAFWGESKGNTLYQEYAVPRDQRYINEMKDLISQMIEYEGNEKQELAAISAGLKSMLFGLWVGSHLDPKPDDYAKGKEAVRLYLHTLFPNYTAAHEID